MNKSPQFLLSSLIALAIAAAVLGLPSPLAADESQPAAECKADCKSNCQVRLEVRGKIPLLERIPLVKYFLGTDNRGPIVAASEIKPESKIERIGVDFDLFPGHMVSFLSDGECQVVCSGVDCASCKESCSPYVTKTASKSTAACCAGDSCGACELAAVQVAQDKKCGEACQELVSSQCCRQHRPAACDDELLELRAANAALQAALGAQETLMQARSEMMDSMLEIASEKARLEAQMTLLADRDEIREQLFALLTENAKLKASAELAEERQAMCKEQAELAVANERLKLRVAELESGQRSTSETARTAKRARTGRKVQ